MSQKEMIGLEHVSLRLGKDFFLKDLTFHVMPGEIFGFLGPSGAGKTTTIKLLTKQLKKDAGSIQVLGKKVEEIKREDYEHIGILSDTNALYERMSLEENLQFFAKLRNIPEKDVTEVLKRMGLYGERKTPYKKSSKGMRQRAVLAAAIMHRPTLLFLDEPTSGLDPGTAREIHKLLMKLNQEGTSIFLTTHNMEEADRLCDRIGILDKGKLAAIGSGEELKLRYAKEEIEILTTEGKRISVAKNEEGAKILYQLLTEGTCVTIHSKEPNLEELFLQLTGREFE